MEEIRNSRNYKSISQLFDELRGATERYKGRIDIPKPVFIPSCIHLIEDRDKLRSDISIEALKQGPQVTGCQSIYFWSPSKLRNHPNSI